MTLRCTWLRSSLRRCLHRVRRKAKQSKAMRRI